MKTRSLTLITLFCAAALLLSGCASAAQAAPYETAPTYPSTQTTANIVVAEGKLVPGLSVDLAFASGGRVKEVLVEEGQTVQAGHVLARLEGIETFLAQEAAAELELIDAEQALRDLNDDTLLALAHASAGLEAAREVYDAAVQSWNGKGSNALTSFDTALNDYIEAETAVRDAQQDLDDLADESKDSAQYLDAEDDLVREQERRAEAYEAILSSYEDPQENGETNSRTTLVEAIACLEAARLQLDKLSGGPDPDLTSLLQARLDAASAAQTAAQEGMKALEIRAPWEGEVVTWDLVVGQSVLPGQVVGAMANTSTWLVETTDLTENSVVLIEVGDAVNITVNALPGETFTGVVEFIHGKGEKYQGDMTYPVRILLDQHDSRWYWNMSVKITIEE